MKLVAWSVTNTGLRREHNEDSFLVDDELGLYAVADGMGGHQGGAHASQLALDVLQEAVAQSVDDLEAAAVRLRDLCSRRWNDEEDEEFRTTEEVIPERPVTERTIDLSVQEEDIDSVPAATAVMRLAARKASASVFSAAARDPELQGMGTTLSAMFYESGRMHLVHAGDSRCYLFRDGRLKQLTDDHSWISEQVRAGTMTEEEARESQFRHIITRSIGFEPDVEVDSSGIVVQAGDCFLLCSDGMSNYVPDEELETIMGETWYRQLPELLIDLANDRGGDDNITVVVVCAANHLP